MPCEFIVLEMSQGGEVTGTLIDRRPLLDGKQAVTTPIPVTISGMEVLTSVSVRTLGNPARFTWIMATHEVMLPLGSDHLEFATPDQVPDSSFSDPAPWPPAK